MFLVPGISLLDADPDLGLGMDPQTLVQLGDRFVLPAVDLPAGPWCPEDLPGGTAAGPPVAALVADGAIIADLVLGGRTCARLFLAGDLLLFPASGPEVGPLRWSAEERSRLAVLDDAAVAAITQHPVLGRRLHERFAEHVRRGFVLQAIAQLPRVEDRLHALLWTVAERAGRVHGDGVHLDLRLTHQALGRMVGARRSTVSLALKELADAGTLRQEEGCWILPAAPPAVLSPPATGTPSRRRRSGSSARRPCTRRPSAPARRPGRPSTAAPPPSCAAARCRSRPAAPTPHARPRSGERRP